MKTTRFIIIQLRPPTKPTYSAIIIIIFFKKIYTSHIQNQPISGISCLETKVQTLLCLYFRKYAY